ncbi:MAG: ABC transporter permease [Phycisphaerae bacterium]
MIQTFAILYDAYRRLRANAIFYVVLGISLLVVAVFALIGVDEEGIHFLKWTWPERTTPEEFYLGVFNAYGVQVWLTWVAAILALISTAFIFPGLIKGGSVSMVLSKPISRLRLFLTQYVAGLMFVFVQVGLFCIAGFLVLGLRGGVWSWKVFLAVPIVLLMFSYLYSVLVLLGVWTRSTVASLLLTLVFWFVLFAAVSTQTFMMSQEVVMRDRARRYEQAIGMVEADIRRWEDRQDPPSPATPATEPAAGQRRFTVRRRPPILGLSPAASLEETRKVLALARQRWEAMRKEGKSYGEIADMIDRLRGPLPKTSETSNLLTRYVSDQQMRSDITGFSVYSDPTPEEERQWGMAVASLKVYGGSWWELVGSSLAFEVVMVALAAWVFCRRDY